MPRYLAAVEYDGSEFLGWQHQAKGATVQDALEAALSKVADCKISLVCAGRTDSGVHGFGQIVHFDSPVTRAARAWMLGANAHLPHTVSVTYAAETDPEFHARYSALAREYRYSLLNRPSRPGLHHRTLAWERLPLNVEAMRTAARMLLGEHDFTSFRTLACQARRPQRRLDRLDIECEGDIIHFTVQANAFLHHMVRNLVGSLLVVGRGEQPPEWIEKILRGKDRSLAGPTAPAGGLVFLGPKYPGRFALPAHWTADPALELWVPLYLREAEAQSRDQRAGSCGPGSESECAPE